MHTTFEPALLVQYIRNGLVEQEHRGYVVMTEDFQNKIFHQLGQNNDYPFYLRSCAKPLQASLLIDYGMDSFFEMTDAEIAICCGSHAGEKVHTQVLEGLLMKIGLTFQDLQCGLHEPLSKTRQFEMNKNGEEITVLHNNCSGKHIMMLGLCKMNHWDIENYTDLNHPLQQAIIKKIAQLCEVTKDYPITKDGCSVPIMSMPLKNMLIGYLNLFTDLKYERIKNAILNNPYVFGGENRTDTKIVANSSNIIAKVGAGGLCIVVNTKCGSGFVVKISDSNMEAREKFVINCINKLGWAEIENSCDIKIINGEIVGNIKLCALA